VKKKRKPIKPGDYFRMPFADPIRNLIVEAIEPCIHGHWLVRYLHNGSTSRITLDACHRVKPSYVKKLFKPPAGFSD
jgi:hypothetical protein